MKAIGGRLDHMSREIKGPTSRSLSKLVEKLETEEKGVREIPQDTTTTVRTR